MKLSLACYGLIIILNAFETTNCEIFSIGTYGIYVGISAILTYGVYKYTYSDCPVRMYSSSDGQFKFKELNVNVSQKVLFGQPLVSTHLFPIIHFHVAADRPSKPLILIFQGPPGTGKNFVSNKIAYHLFECCHYKPYVNFYSASRDFYNYKLVDKYVKNIVENIKHSLYACSRPLFIFDEVDKMPEELLEQLDWEMQINFFNPETVNGFSKAIIIFISNSGSNEIIKTVYESISSGIERRQLKFDDFSHVPQLFVSEKYDVKFFPFFPLEKEHILLCTKNIAKKFNMSIDDSLLDYVFNDMTFSDKYGALFSDYGCKGVEQALSKYYYKISYQKN